MITGYDFQWRVAGAGWSGNITSGITTGCMTVEGLTAAEDYQSRVRAINGVGSSAWSSASASVTAEEVLTDEWTNTRTFEHPVLTIGSDGERLQEQAGHGAAGDGAQSGDGHGGDLLGAAARHGGDARYRNGREREACRTRRTLTRGTLRMRRTYLTNGDAGDPGANDRHCAERCTWRRSPILLDARRTAGGVLEVLSISAMAIAFITRTAVGTYVVEGPGMSSAGGQGAMTITSSSDCFCG